MRLISALLLGAFVFALASLAIVFSTKGGIFAISEKRTCFVKIWTELPEDTEYLILGSSRLMRGIQVDLLSDAFGLSETGVVSMAHPNASFPLDLALVRQLPDENNIETVIFGVSPRSTALMEKELSVDGTAPPVKPPLSFGEINPRFLLGAEFASVATLVHEQTDNTALAYWQVMRMAAARISYTFPQLLDTLKRRAYEQIKPMIGRPHQLAYDPTRRQDCNDPIWSNPDEIHQHGGPWAKRVKTEYREIFADWSDPAPLGFFDEPEHSFDRIMIQNLITHARSKSWNIYFLYVPGLTVPVDPSLGEAFREAFGVPLLVPPSALQAQISDGGYHDPTHLNNYGNTLFSDWLIAQLSTGQSRTDL